ncbi:hypothetical protein vB_PsyM_KIL3b_0118 [Pseudomonas phage vB_PsyM_KIL3b]|uniref:Uncharacterized protein n=6 Tax=Flaumdravirus TaxID=2560133 RepID=A0A142IE68_9CAUD|nr:hypothetical protein BH774_gp085 [Pseudomonas phage vB_PsyM_KIL1]YP_009616797.1 hypothetical protein FDI83_gp093 [Pseudomonas phage vB_PsyM_KIL4]AMR57523.1 hypothetical protein vB_PsyM_KIL2_0123 [Pseudomonas phage vB_PsyM_KIL2]AMR57685.1 hypothetical protein vB_PsyM_KIL3_0118 [Pseudomonas phage vB_PsyM_KIL3]AMR58016.1 hypothetical protein vB_PsyM_KIL5_0125 [Pseudomonas phage vB_PsyM_KIL5]AMR58183.1 hypothetical protein vB_PsyM_KIL3b_0118 [Pseudomonas phage vB_PsyM_KIL3b]WKV20499.1 hypothet
MSQSKKQSMKETLSNTGIGMVGSWLITMVTFHLVSDLTIASTIATIGCTVWSIGRGYCVRRYFNSRGETK